MVVAISMIFVASPKYAQFFVAGGVVVLFGSIFIMMASYRVERLLIWRNPEKFAKGYQTLHGLYAIGSEELGLFVAVSVILLFVIIIWRFMVIASNAQDLYGALLVTGVLAHISIQVILNIAVVTNTIPNTGISLPFISYGGTSVLFLLAEIGLVLSVSRGIHFGQE